MSIKVVSFNVENLFSRARALNLSDNRRTKVVLEKIGQLQGELEKSVYDKPTILSLIRDLNWYIEISQEIGKLYTVVNRRPHRIVANGRDDWNGTIKLRRAKFSDMSRGNTAKVLNTVNADICAIVEAENILTLREFDTHLMRSRYKYEMLIDGNDRRGIDVGMYSKYPLGTINTHMFDRVGNSRVFSRDCLRVETIVNGTSVHLLINHLKSKGYGSTASSDARRKKQADRIKEIIEENYDLRTDHVIVAGDLNDTPDSRPLSNLMQMNNLFDVLELKFGNDNAQRWTYHYRGAFNQIDYLLVSKPLKDKFLSAGVERRGMADLHNLTDGAQSSFPSITSTANAGSDHGAVWATFDL